MSSNIDGNWWKFMLVSMTYLIFSCCRKNNSSTFFLTVIFKWSQGGGLWRCCKGKTSQWERSTWIYKRFVLIFSIQSLLFYSFKTLLINHCSGYLGGHAATVGSVLVTNLKTRFRKGEWDRVEVLMAFILDLNIFAKQEILAPVWMNNYQTFVLMNGEHQSNIN